MSFWKRVASVAGGPAVGAGIAAANALKKSGKDSFNKGLDSIGAASQARADQISDMYAPAMDKLREQMDDRSMVDHVEATAGSRFERGVSAAQHMQAAQGGMTSRQAALAQFQNQLAGAANVDAQVTTTRLNQNEIREGAQDRLGALQLERGNQLLGEQRHAEQLKLQRQMHNESMKQQNKNNKKSFWGNVAGTAVGVGAMLMV